MARRSQPRPPAAPPPDAPRRLWPTALEQRPWLGPLWVLLLLLLLYPEPILQGRTYLGADTIAADAFRQVGDAERAQGRYPLWNPYIFGGMPTFGSLAYTLGVYPPTVVFEWLHRLGLPPLTWLIGHLFFGGLGMWWLLGRWRLPWASRCLGVVVWLWSARLVAWAVHGHGTKLGAEMYLPWLVGLVWTVLVSGGLRPVALAGLLLGLQLLRGHVQASYYTLLILGFLTVWHLVWPLPAGAAPVGTTSPLPRPGLPTRLRRAGLVVASLAIGMAIGAALLVPVHAYADLSTRGAGGAAGGQGTPFDYATAWSLAPEDLAAVFLPAVAGFGKATYLGRMPFTDNPVYLGLLVPLLAVAAWLARPQRSLVWACGAASLLVVLVAMGRFSPGLYQLAYELLPYFDKFRVPSMIMVLVVLLLALLAALGSAALADPAADRTRWLRRGAFALLGLGGLMVVLGATGLGEAAHREWLVGVAARGGKQAPPVILAEAWTLHRAFLIRGGLLLLAAGGAGLLAARRPGFRVAWLVPVLLVLVAVDQWGVVKLVTHPQRALFEVVRLPDGGGRLAPAGGLVQPWRGADAAAVDPGLASALRDAVGHGRVLPLGADGGANDYMTAGIRSLGGYHPAKPAVGEAVRQRLYGRVPAGHVARWLGAAAVTYPGRLSPELLGLLADHGLDLLPEGEQAGGMVVYRVRDPLPRARLVDAWRPVSALPAGDALEPFLDAIAEGRHDPAAGVVLLQPPAPLPETGPQPLPAPEFVRDGLNEVVLAVTAPRPVLLLLADVWAPGWQATIDGQPAALLRADLMLRAVAVPAGRHELRFEYHDPALARGLALAAAGVLAVLVLLAAAWARGRWRGVVTTGGGEATGD